MRLPQGYAGKPKDYEGEIYLESQMKAHAQACVDESLRKLVKEMKEFECEDWLIDFVLDFRREQYDDV